MSENPRTYEGMRQWVVLARLGEEITAAEAARRLSVISKAEQHGDPEPPDVRSDFHRGVDAPTFAGV